MNDFERWFADPENPKDLEEALNLPIVQKALNLIISNNVPSGFTTGDAQLMTAQAAQNWHYASGFHDAFKRLRNLAIAVQPEEPEIQAFDPKWLIQWHEERQKANKTN